MIVFTLCHIWQVWLKCAAFDIVKSSCMSRSHILAQVLTLHPQMSMGRGGGCTIWLFGAENSIASVFVSFKSRWRDASHTFTSITQRDIHSVADAESLR